jgi:hypothetical protein
VRARWWDGYGWQWPDLGSPGDGQDIPSPVGVTVVDGCRPYAFVVGGDGHLWVHWWSYQP